MKLIVKTEYERLSLVSPWLCLSLCSAATIDQGAACCLAWWAASCH